MTGVQTCALPIFDFRLHYCYLNFIANLKKMKIYSNKRCEAARENIGPWINGAKEKKKRRR